jgi:NAD(P)-dependent dehydrogenase (short-subunit alcohol dehydrogenase family)
MTSVNHSVLVTGASGGVGSALTAHLADHGWTVFAGVRSLAAASSLAVRHHRVIPVEMDLLDDSTLAKARFRVAEHLDGEHRPGLGALVNNAGKSVDGPLELLPVDELLDAFAVNVVGQIAVTRAFLPLLRPAGGRIVNIGGAAGRVALPMYGALSASKAALDSVTDVLRMELLHQGVDVTYVEPGALDTSFFGKSAATRDVHGYAGDADTQASYAVAVSRVATAMSSTMPGDVRLVVKAVERALNASRPAPRYVVGSNARIVTGIVRRLPVRTRDQAVMRTMNLGAEAFKNS